MNSEFSDLNRKIRDELLLLCQGGGLRALLSVVREHFPLFKKNKITFSLNFVASYSPIASDDVHRLTFPVGGLITSFSFPEDIEKRILELTKDVPTAAEEAELQRLKENGMNNTGYNIGFLEPPPGAVKTCAACRGRGYIHE